MIGITRLLALLIPLTLVGCAGPKATTIASKPSGAFVTVNDKNVGATPVAYTFDFSRTPVYVIRARKEGFYEATVQVDKHDPLLKQGIINLALPEDEAWTRTDVSAATNKFVRIQIDPSISPAEAWQRMLDSVSERYLSFEMMEASSGTLRSIPIQQAFHHQSSGKFTVRTQFFASIATKQPLVIKVQVKSDYDDGSGTWREYNRVFREDAQLIAELQSRLGLK